MNHVVTGTVGDGVIAGAAVQEVVAVAAVDVVVAGVAPDGVVIGLPGDQAVVACGTAQHHGVAEEIVLAQETDGAVGRHIDEQLAKDVVGGAQNAVRPWQSGGPQPGAGVVLVDGAGFDHILRREEDAGTQVAGAGVGHDHRSE